MRIVMSIVVGNRGGGFLAIGVATTTAENIATLCKA